MKAETACAVAGNEITTLILVPVSLLLTYPFQITNWLYLVIAIALGSIFVHKVWLLIQSLSDLELTKSLFKNSIVYMMLLLVAIVVDCLLIFN
jgi:heme O synthase-like polyprenyltransferase